MKASYPHIKALILLLAIVVSVLTWQSCNRALDEEPRSLLTSTLFYRTASDALLAVNAAYDHLGGGTSNSGFSGVYFNLYWAMQAIASDDGVAGIADPNSVQLSEFRFDPSNAWTTEIWQDIYKTVNVANIAIANIPNIEMEASLKQRLLGEVHFIRGLMYFELVRLYGNVPLVLTPTVDLSILDILQATPEEVYQQVISDLMIAETNLPVTYTGADIGRATTGAASAYLARVYLTREDWAQAAEHAQKVMATGAYRLLDDYRDIFLIANNSSKEIVFGIGFTFNNDAIWETSQFNVRTLPVDLNRNSLAWEIPTADVYNAFDALDRRREVTFQTSFTESDGTVLTFEPHIFKYWDQAAEPSASSSGTDFYALRYSDVLLMHAEAVNEANGGPTAEAYESLNRVRRRARFAEDEERPTLPDLSNQNQADFRAAVLLERRREFVWEGQRWFDLVRTGSLKEKVEAAKPGVTVDENKHKLFPIPQREIDLNSSLVQNPGY